MGVKWKVSMLLGLNSQIDVIFVVNIVMNGTMRGTFYDIEMGNVNDVSIMEIWESAKFKDLRTKMRKCITPICFACSRYYN